MAAPRAALEAAQRAEELHRQVYGNPDQPQETPEEPEALEQPEEPEQPEQDDDETDELTNAPADDGGHAEDDLAERYRKLEAAHTTLQGKYRAEVPRMSSRIRELEQQLSQEQQAKAAAEKQAETVKVELSDAHQRLKDELGDDAADSLNAYTKSLVQAEIGEFKQQQSQNTEQQFWDSVYRRVPDFDQVNSNTAFVQWLQSSDPLTGLPYQDTLNQAGQGFDSATVIDVFQQFKKEQSKPTPTPKSASPTAPEQQVAPARKGTRTQPAQKPNYTAADFTELQMQKQKGMWNGRDAEFRALEAEIHAALIGG